MGVNIGVVMGVTEGVVTGDNKRGVGGGLL